MTDARFEDGVDKPLRLMAWDAEDLQVLASLAQDAVFLASDTRWNASDRHFAVLLNRVRWEETAPQGTPERVRAVLLIEDVTGVRSQGVQKGDPDTVLSLLDITFEPGPDGTGEVVLTLAGDGLISCAVETLGVRLKDVTQPYGAVSGRRPSHPD
ncbi:DUF2948 family protein [Salipiger sp. IMCC34102]|uniref:DUF2948 family protein n=1 Tax=Salipiger sp. IMCC34102 TaxID=2510647 RepID=UPI00101C8E7D|nr:DUF2948 family protein [Salipiger sp. IMCC34102]RYH02737.1 DUF2948 family protein [Salipiger sp. IMCC34102]